MFFFMSDTVFRIPSQVISNPTDMVTKDYGRLPAEIREYFNNEAERKDTRKGRYPHAIKGKPIANAELTLHYDSAVLEEELYDIEELGDKAWESIFNIFESVSYNEIASNHEEVDIRLTKGKDEGPFWYYVPHSVSFANEAVSTMFYGNVNDKLIVTKWIYFELYSRKGKKIPIKIWCHWSTFSEEYPISTIKKIVPPLSLEHLANPSLIPDGIRASVASATLSSHILNKAIHTDSFSNYISYNTRYLLPDGKSIYIPFNILYKGNEPSTILIRAAIRKLVEESKLLTETQWRKKFPDLFVMGQFYIVPLWDNITKRPTREQYCSIIELSSITDIATSMFPIGDYEYISKYLEVLNVAYIETPLMVLRDPSNTDDITLRYKHPSYQYYPPTNPSFNYQEEHTKLFSSTLNRALAVANGVTIDKLFSSTKIGRQRFVSFTINDLEFHILSKESYMTIRQQG